uniref:Reverse transcriptase Ty1/copia-type domain-containing protein n=1 Tax=Tanacetum cinerariifolium TaxID=118510 RepID=A0A6L2NWU0_TANCI|nr:hypothetical protein [Tanacetum cinerariifolium]
MHNIGKTLAELHAMLKLHEKCIPKKAETLAVLAIRKGKIQKDKKKPQGEKGKANGKNKLAYAPKTKISPPPKRDNLAKDSICHHCKETTVILHLLLLGVLFQFLVRVSKRRNQTLLDMVRSIMKLTTLPKSFWGYALETATRILNMVPTKKVDRTPYEIWHGKAPKLSARLPQAPDRYGYYDDVEEYELGDLDEPPNYKAALVDHESDKCLEAMNTKMQSMKDNQVWILVELPSNGQTIRIKWLFKKKTDMDGNVHTFKACLVAKGYTQTYRVDYGETSSLVVDIRVIRIILSIVTFYDYEIWQMDVKTAFLNGHLSEDVYMVQPEGFVDPKHPNKVCELQRFIYGLKQASRSWNKRFDEEIKKIDFTQNPNEPCVYLKASRSNVAFLVLYVGDILLMKNNVTMLEEVKSWLFKVLTWRILKKFRVKNSKKGYTLMIEKPDYRKSQGAKTPTEVQRMLRVPYASAIGSLVIANACSLSHSISIGLLSDGMTPPSPSINFLIHTTSIDASAAAMYSASVEDIVVVVFLALFESTAPPLSMNTYPV